MQINVLEYFLATCDRHPARTAVGDDHGSWTFQQLRQRAGSIARAIAGRTEAVNQPVATYLPKNSEAVA